MKRILGPLTGCLAPLIVAGVVGLIYFCSTPRIDSPYDYTLRIADCFLAGRLGLTERPPSWLNEMIPVADRYYSVFPLGSVLTMLPLAVWKKLVPGSMPVFPGPLIGALIGAALAFLYWHLSRAYELSLAHRACLVVGFSLGTWSWTNLVLGGAWQLACGFGVLGTLGALYYTLVNPRPFLAGCAFSLASGNRPEVFFCAPVFVLLSLRNDPWTWETLRARMTDLLWAALPVIMLGVLTLLYNELRFGAPLQMGYSLIPGVLDEPWYKNGIFSPTAIPLNFQQMLLEPWKRVEGFPYVVPTGFGGSILLSSPFLLLALRSGCRSPVVKHLSWAALCVLTLILWCHGNPGGWQYSYRYAMVLLPWLFLVLLEKSPPALPWSTAALVAVSVAINGWATYLFLWTGYVHP